MPNLIIVLASLQMALASGFTPQGISTPKIDDSTIINTITEAYVFGIPIVLEALTRRKLVDGANPRHGFINSFTHLSFFPDASFRLVVRPNADTYYSTAFLDLRKEPIVLSVP